MNPCKLRHSAARECPRRTQRGKESETKRNEKDQLSTFTTYHHSPTHRRQNAETIFTVRVAKVQIRGGEWELNQIIEYLNLALGFPSHSPTRIMCECEKSLVRM